MVRKLAVAMLGSVGVFLAVGCAADRHQDIPRSAMLVEKHTGDVRFTATNPGEAYVYDRSSGKLLYSGRMQRNETLAVDAKDDRITLNGRTVMDERIRDNDELRIFFREEPRAETAGSRVIVEPRSDSGVTVQPADRNSAVTVQPGGSDSRITVQPGEDRNQRVIVEPPRRD